MSETRRGQALAEHDAETWQTPVGLAVYRRLNLACGRAKRAGWLNVDVNPAVEPDVVCDLLTFPWPLETSSYHEVFLSHFLEHVPADRIVQFMDELWRVCAPHAIVEVHGPYWTSELTHGDPTHHRGLSLAFFDYFSADGRRRRGVEHYPIRANFVVEKSRYVVNPGWEAASAAALEFAIKHYVNVVDQLHVWLRAVKR